MAEPLLSLRFALKDERLPSQKLKGRSQKSPAIARMGGAIRQALYASKLCSYAQGYMLMRAAAKDQWNSITAASR